MKRHLAKLMLAAVLLSANGGLSFAQVSDDVVKIGVLTREGRGIKNQIFKFRETFQLARSANDVQRSCLGRTKIWPG